MLKNDQCSLTPKELNEIYDDRFGSGKLTHAYIKYLYQVDGKKLWTPKRIAAEYGVCVKAIENILWPRGAEFKMDRRKGDRRKNGK